ncbi:MAG: hypothetical protein ACT4N8_12505 [Sphingosinicella sp.]|uniref:hypothetical protein n=1 Tax=Sphingosinicella sp. TaxID=1917971 RepID=UPI0040381F8A
MPWLWKVILVGALLGLCVFLAAAVPWLPARLGFLALGAVVFIWAMRDPALAYRRAFHFLIMLPAIPLGFSVSAGMFGAEAQQGGIFKVIVDGSQALSPWLWFGLAALCLIGDALVAARDRAGRRQVYQAEAIRADLIEGRKLVRVEFPFRPTRDAAVVGAEIRLRGIGNYSEGVTTQITIGGITDDATPNKPQRVRAGTSAGVMVKLELDEQAFRRIRKRRGGFFGRFPITGAVKLRADSRIEPLPITLA